MGPREVAFGGDIDQHVEEGLKVIEQRVRMIGEMKAVGREQRSASDAISKASGLLWISHMPIEQTSLAAHVDDIAMRNIPVQEAEILIRKSHGFTYVLHDLANERGVCLSVVTTGEREMLALRLDDDVVMEMLNRGRESALGEEARDERARIRRGASVKL